MGAQTEAIFGRDATDFLIRTYLTNLVDIGILKPPVSRMDYTMAEHIVEREM